MRKVILLILLFGLSVFITSVTAQEGQAYYATARSVRVRTEPNTRATILTNLKKNEAVVILEVVEGGQVNGDTTWYRVNIGGKDGYIHSSFLTNTPPTAADAPAVSSAPAVSVPPVTSSNFTCSCSKTCTQMTSCDEAYFQLRQCGCSKRDGDSDGVPCEKICPGG